MLQPNEDRSAETAEVRCSRVQSELLILADGRMRTRAYLKEFAKICSLKTRAEPSRCGGDDIPKDGTARVGSTKTKMYWRMDDKRVELTAGWKQSCW